MKKLSRILAAALGLALAASLAACGSSSTTTATATAGAAATAAPSSATAAATATTAAATSADLTKTYHFGVNAWGTAPILTADANEEEYAIKCLGMTDDRASDDTSADKEMQNIQNFIAQGVDGLVVEGAGGTTIPEIGKEAAAAKIPFALCLFVGKADDRTALDGNEYYAGAAASDFQADGAVIAKMALADGCKTACLIGGAIGDPNMDNRSKGFTDAFTAGGGTVLAEERCTDNSECLTKASSMLSGNKDVNCVYSMSGDYVEGTLTAIDTIGLTNVKTYMSAVNKGSADYIRSGKISGGSGGTTLAGDVSPALLLNMLDGHPIKDKDGKAPFFQVPTSVVNADNIDDYVKTFCTDGTYAVSADVIKNLAYRYNPDVTYQTFLDTIANELTVDACIKASK